MLTIPVVQLGPPPSTREVVKVCKLTPGETFHHPGRPDGLSHRGDHLFNSATGAWRLNRQAWCDYEMYPYSVWFSDGTIGVVRYDRLRQALAALNVSLPT
jgi:hypothetical protein